jgi:4-amino-4-deoxy-L-arabinose transferase-like glycosyltransferase
VSADAERSSHAIGDGLVLTLILGVGLAARAIAWSRTAVMFNDGPIFLAMAEAIGEGRWAEVLAHPYHPLYPTLIALAAVFPVELETAAVAVSILGGLLGVAAVFWFVRDAFGSEAARLAAWIVALHPWAVDFSADVMSDGLYVGFFLVAFAAMARAVEHPNVWAALGCGLASGLAYLVRPEGAGLLVAGVLLLIARGWADRAQRGRVVAACAAMLLAGAVLILPFVGMVGQQTGEFVLTQKKSISNLVGASSGIETPADEGRAARNSDQPSASLPLPESAVRSDGQGPRPPPGTWLGLLEAIVRVGTTSLAVFRFELVPFVLLGLWASRSSRKPWREMTLGLPIVLYSGLLVLLVWGVGYVGRRHALAPWLPVVGLSALGWRFLCTALADWDDRRGGARLARLRTPRAAAIALVAVLLIGWGFRDVRPRRVDRAPVRTAAEWLEQNHPNSGPVAAQKLRTAFYAGARFVPLPPGHDGLLADHLRRRAARWVVIDDSKLNDHLGLEAGIGHWLHPVHVVPSEGRNILVLAVKAEPAT